MTWCSAALSSSEADDEAVERIMKWIIEEGMSVAGAVLRNLEYEEAQSSESSPQRIAQILEGK